MAQRKINWASRAVTDRTDILEYWYEKTGSVDYPIKLEGLFSSTISLFSKMPDAGIVFDQQRNIRFVLVKYYRIYYTSTEQHFTVLSIWDTRRDQQKFSI
ncbi:MAG: hypothetical protein WEA58_01070 [Balneolaceae bacterium]